MEREPEVMVGPVADAPSRRGVPLAAALATFWFSAAIGCLLARRPRRAAFWLVTDWMFYALMVAAILTNHPRLMWTGFIGFFAWRLPAAVDSYRVARRAPEHASWGTLIKAWAVLTVGSVVVPVAIVKPFFAEAFQMPSGSMIPTLTIGDHLFVDKTARRPSRGDVIVFEYPLDRSTKYIKRVIGLEGDVLEIKAGKVLVNGHELERERLAEGCADIAERMPEAADAAPCLIWRETIDDRSYEIGTGWSSTARDTERLVVPEGTVFVLGDNRDNSSDSRVWGYVPLDHVKGTARFIWWSRMPGGPMRWDRVNTRVR